MKYIVGFGILAILLVFGILFLNNRTQSSSVTQPLPADEAPITQPAPTNEVEVPEGWRTYTSRQYGFTIIHPADMNQDITSDGEHLYKLGPSQSEGTELYDGISVRISSGNLAGQTLQEFVNKKYADIKSEPIQPQLTEIQPTTIGGMAGYMFHVSSIGDSNYIFLPKGDKGYIQIVDSTVEPTNREQTFRKTVDKMLSTLRVN